MVIIVCSNKFNKFYEKWEKIALKNQFIKFVFINDNEKNFLENNSSLNNTIIINNTLNSGKIKSIIKYILDTNTSDWIMSLDDKDVFLNENLNFFISKVNLLNEENVYVADTLSINKKVIGNKIFSNTTLKEFYIKQGNIGDKVIIFHSKYILHNREEYNNFLSFPCKIYETVLYKCCFEKIITRIDPLIIHPYNPDGITHNNLNNKLENYEYYLWETQFYLNNKPCFKIIISRLFILWFLRNKGKINLKASHKFLYGLLRVFNLFPIIHKIYLSKLKKVIEN